MFAASRADVPQARTPHPALTISDTRRKGEFAWSIFVFKEAVPPTGLELVSARHPPAASLTATRESGAPPWSDAPSGTPDVSNAYDNFSRLTMAYCGAHTLSFGYDQLSRNISVTQVADGVTRTLGYA